MRDRIKNFVSEILRKFGYSFLTNAEKNFLSELGIERFVQDWSFAKDVRISSYVLERIKMSRGQLLQDLVALYIFEKIWGMDCPRTPYFVEFGATDGVSLSNTYLLEKTYKWDGLLVEPCKKWHSGLMKNRECKIDMRCVLDSSGRKVEFLEVDELELSTISGFEPMDTHKMTRLKNNQYSVETISLNDLLDEYDSPNLIDFMSIDTEGSELAILSNFDFLSREIIFLAVEHNFTENESALDVLLRNNGFIRILPQVSKWDAWYISEKYAEIVF